MELTGSSGGYGQIRRLVVREYEKFGLAALRGSVPRDGKRNPFLNQHDRNPVPYGIQELSVFPDQTAVQHLGPGTAGRCFEASPAEGAVHRFHERCGRLTNRLARLRAAEDFEKFGMDHQFRAGAEGRRTLVPEEGFEPSRSQGPRDFESRASAYSATPAIPRSHRRTGARRDSVPTAPQSGPLPSPNRCRVAAVTPSRHKPQRTPQSDIPKSVISMGGSRTTIHSRRRG